MKSASRNEGIKRFWLHHSEKLILSLAVGLTGLFFWLGFKEKPFREKSASDLVGMANEASNYIGREDSWEQIRAVDTRQAELDIVQKIEAGEKAVDTSKYPFGPISIRAKKPGLRKDPVLKAPVELVAHFIRPPVIINPGKLKKGTVAKDPLADLPLAKMPASPKPGQENSAEAGRNRDEAPDWGTTVLAIHEKFLPGIRPRPFGINVNTEQAFVTDIVAVTALVEIKDQKNDYLEKLMDSIGYFPKRDQPVYKFFEVERSKMENGEFGKWENISNLISRYQSAAPNMMTLPDAEFSSAPEIVSEEFYDPILTSPIPAITQFDYRPYVNHPKLANRKFDPIKKVKAAEAITDFDAPVENEKEPDDEDEKASEDDDLLVRRGSDLSRYKKMLEAKNSKNEYKLVRFFDLSRNKKAGEVYRYRIRLWLSDPNHEVDASVVSGEGGGRGGMSTAGGSLGGMANEGGGRGGMSTAGGGRGGMSTAGGSLGGMANEGGGRGGMSTAGGSLGGMANEGGGRGGMANEGGGRGRGGMEGGGRGGAGMGQEGGGRGTGRGTGGGSQENSEEDQYPYMVVTNQMTHPDVRARLAAAKEEKDKKDSTIVYYFVKENGYEEPIQVPKGREDLRFARPTPWSEPVEIKIPYQAKADLLAGRVDVPKGIKLESLEIAETESAIDVVVAYWSDVYNAMLPARKKTFRGELLNLAAKVNVLNPISWQVHTLEDAKIDSDSVVVDILGGRELELPIRDELMKYHRPSDLLVMQGDGTMKISNELDDRTQFKRALLQKDDSNEVGTPKAKPAEPPRGRSGDGPAGRGGRDQ